MALAKFPVEMKITFPKEQWPWTTPEEGQADIAYSIEEIMMLLCICSQVNLLGYCCLSMSDLLDLLGVKTTKENYKHYATIINCLIHRCNETDCISLKSDAECNPDKPDTLLHIRLEGTWSPAKTRFINISIVEFEQIRKCAIKHKKPCWVLLLLLMSIKSCFYSFEIDGKKHGAGVIAKNTLAKRCEVSQPTIDSLISILVKEEIIDILSGKKYGVSNVYCLHGDSAALPMAMKRQLEYMHIEPVERPARLLNKRFEGLY